MKSEDGPQCDYCGHALRPDLYFCPNCSREVQAVGAVLPRVSAPFLSDGTKVRLLAPEAMGIFWTYLAAILGLSICGALLFSGGGSSGERETNHLAFELFWTVMFAAFTLGYSVYHHRSLLPLLGTFALFHRASSMGILCLLPILAINYGYHHLLIETLLDQEDLFDREWEVLLASPAVAYLFIGVMPAITEEIGFRGILQTSLHRALSPWRAITFASFLFAACHFSVISLPYLMGVGMLLGWMRWKTGSLYPSMLVHFLHNSAVVWWTLER